MSDTDFHDWFVSAMSRWIIRLEPVMKRTENAEGVRDWYLRHTWKAKLPGHEEASTLSSGWEGFDSAEVCLADLWQKLSEYEKQNGQSF